MRLELHVRRFFCQNQECKRQIFTERLPEVVAPSARRTTRLCDLLPLIGFAMGGEAGNCLVERMGLEASPETLLRLVRQQEERQVPTPRVLGVDDFCFCRRRSYGAISSILSEISHRLASRPGGRDLQKVVASPSWCGDYQPGSRWSICRRSKARSAKSQANS